MIIWKMSSSPGRDQEINLDRTGNIDWCGCEHDCPNVSDEFEHSSLPRSNLMLIIHSSS